MTLTYDLTLPVLLFGALYQPQEVSEEDVHQQIRRTADAFAVDMLLLKFIQGLPVVGLLGGAANPLYYHKIIQYTQMKYKRRYLLNCQKKM